MTAHTPGPWTNDDGLVNGLETRNRGLGKPSLDIFDVADWPNELREEAMANANLIAAAPDMLAALVNAMAMADVDLKENRSGRTDDCAKAYAMCAAAVAKATETAP